MQFAIATKANNWKESCLVFRRFGRNLEQSKRIEVATTITMTTIEAIDHIEFNRGEYVDVHQDWFWSLPKDRFGVIFEKNATIVGTKFVEYIKDNGREMIMSPQHVDEKAEENILEDLKRPTIGFKGQDKSVQGIHINTLPLLVFVKFCLWTEESRQELVNLLLMKPPSAPQTPTKRVNNCNVIASLYQPKALLLHCMRPAVVVINHICATLLKDLWLTNNLRKNKTRQTVSPSCIDFTIDKEIFKKVRAIPTK